MDISVISLWAIVNVAFLTIGMHIPAQPYTFKSLEACVLNVSQVCVNVSVLARGGDQRTTSDVRHQLPSTFCLR